MNIIESLFTRTSKPKLYIHTPTAAISEHIQKILFTLGYRWMGTPRRPKFLDQSYVIVYRNGMCLYTNDRYDTDAYLVEANTFLHNNILKKLH